MGLPLAHANEPGGGGTCNNYGHGNIIVAPFCGAQFAPPAAPPLTQPPMMTTTKTSRPGGGEFTFTPFPPPPPEQTLTPPFTLP